jgi:hypothetical protein
METYLGNAKRWQAKEFSGPAWELARRELRPGWVMIPDEIGFAMVEGDYGVPDIRAAWLSGDILSPVGAACQRVKDDLLAKDIVTPTTIWDAVSAGKPLDEQMVLLNAHQNPPESIAYLASLGPNLILQMDLNLADKHMVEFAKTGIFHGREIFDVPQRFVTMAMRCVGNSGGVGANVPALVCQYEDAKDAWETSPWDAVLVVNARSADTWAKLLSDATGTPHITPARWSGQASTSEHVGLFLASLWVVQGESKALLHCLELFQEPGWNWVNELKAKSGPLKGARPDDTVVSLWKRLWPNRKYVGPDVSVRAYSEQFLSPPCSTGEGVPVLPISEVRMQSWRTVLVPQIVLSNAVWGRREQQAWYKAIMAAEHSLVLPRGVMQKIEMAAPPTRSMVRGVDV